MKARIGIADTGREIDVAVADREELVEHLESAYREGVPILWFKNDKGRDIGIPLGRIAFVELVDDPDQAIGFGR